MNRYFGIIYGRNDRRDTTPGAWEHPIAVASELLDVLGLIEISAKPTLPECPKHPVAQFGAAHAFTDSDDLADPV